MKSLLLFLIGKRFYFARREEGKYLVFHSKQLFPSGIWKKQLIRWSRLSKPYKRKREATRGQTLIYLLTVMALLMLLGLWLVDMNTCILSRIRSQNGSDAAALSAAQWQARSLNAVGEINLVKAIAALMEVPLPGEDFQERMGHAGSEAESFAITQSALTSLQSRIQFVGPMMAMIASQQAAKNNGIPVNQDYTADMQNHALDVEDYYKDAFRPPEFWGSDEWINSYSRMIRYVADQGIAAAPDNAEYYGAQVSGSPEANEWLLQKSFYSAIAIRNWCFLRKIIHEYEDFHYWGPVTVLPQVSTENEFFALGIKHTLSGFLGGEGDSLDNQLRNYVESELASRQEKIHGDWPQYSSSIRWATYDTRKWGVWLKAYKYETSLLGNPREPYDYSGCDAVTMVTSKNQLMLDFDADASVQHNSWLLSEREQVKFGEASRHLHQLNKSSELDVKALAAAKPFGQLPGVEESPHHFKLVLPVFDKIRLIPIALASSYGNSDRMWLRHKASHLPAYSLEGINSLPEDCFYCNQLMTWEDREFRQEGIEWLEKYGCHPPVAPVGGGGGGSGGSGPIPPGNGSSQGTGGAPYAH